MGSSGFEADGELARQRGLDMSPQAVAATEILDNAIRLYKDAQLLFENGSFPSSASLSILAIEELAKFAAFARLQPLGISEWRRHPAKHVASASIVLRHRYHETLAAVIAEQGLAIDGQALQRLKDMDYRDNEMDLFDEVLHRITLDGSLGHFSEAYTKGKDRLKQVGFYVDVDEQTGAVLSTPTMINREIAEEHLDFARDVLATIRVHLRTGSSASGA